MVGGGRRSVRSRSRISGGSIDRVCKDIEHVHDEVEHVIIAHHTELEGSEVETHLKEVDAHLQDLMKHGKELKTVMPLTALSVGEEGEIVELRGGKGMLRRLLDMGFTPSTKVKMLASCPPGPVLIGVRDTRIALGRGIAQKIMVNREYK